MSRKRASNMYKFKLEKSQIKKLKKWQSAKDKDSTYAGAAGGAYEYCFTPTGLGTLVTVKCIDGTEIDLSEIENW